MDAHPASHPTDQTLSSYGLGKLDNASAVAINEHLEQCADCRQRVSAISADSFLERVRDGRKPSGNTTFGESLPGGARGHKVEIAPAPPPASTLPPGLADHSDYEIRRELGRGGMGVVYLAHNKLMGRDEVLKVMGRQIMERPEVLDRFRREIRAVAKLRHPNIVTAYHAFRLDESIVFAMEFVDGLDLSRMVKAKGALLVAHACNFVYQAALGLQHAHEEGLVHRDIKPGNLMYSSKGSKATIKILDFGLAKATREQKVDSALTSEGQALGTPDFIAPEQILDAQSADIRADIYSLGGTLFYLLTGRPPFQANSLYDMYQAHISRDADPLNLVRPEVPAELAALVAKMMAKEPGKRFQTPRKVAEALTPSFKRESTASKGGRMKVLDAVQAEPGQRSGRAGPAPTQSGQDSALLLPQATDAADPHVPTPPSEGVIELRDRETSTSSVPRLMYASSLRGRPRWVWLAVAATLISALFGAWWAADALGAKKPHGIIELRNLPKDAEVSVDGEPIPVHRPGGAGIAEIPARVGKRKVTFKKGGFETTGDEVVVSKAGERIRLDVRLIPVRSTSRTAQQQPVEAPTITKSGPGTRGTTPLPVVTLVLGDWTVVGDELIQSDDRNHAEIAFGNNAWSEYDLTLDVNKVKGSGHGIGVQFYRLNSATFCWFGLGVFQNKGCELYFQLNGRNMGRKGDTNEDNWSSQGIDVNRWYSVKIEVRKEAVKAYLNDCLLFKESHSAFSRGRVGLRTMNVQAKFRRIKVTDPDGRLLFESYPTFGTAPGFIGLSTDARETVELRDEDPGDDLSDLNERAWSLATDADRSQRDGGEAVELATRACRGSAFEHAMYLDTLAAAYAEVGNFEEAVRWQKQAIEREGQGRYSKEYRERLGLYTRKIPYHQGETVPAEDEPVAAAEALQTKVDENGANANGGSATARDQSLRGAKEEAGRNMPRGERREEGFVRLFNGKNQDGWTNALPGNGSTWGVTDDGILEGRGEPGPGNTAILVSDRKSLTNFVLRVRVRFLGEGGGHIVVRQSGAEDPKRGYHVQAFGSGNYPICRIGRYIDGPSADMGAKPQPVAFQDDQWKTIEIIAIENEIAASVLGTGWRDSNVDLDAMYRSGSIAVTCWGHIQIKEILLRELPDGSVSKTPSRRKTVKTRN